MLSGNRISWFAITFIFALPSMMLLFRSDGGMSSREWMTSGMFAAVIATGAAALFGQGNE